MASVPSASSSALTKDTRNGQSRPLTGRQYELAAGDYRATVTALGAACGGCSTRPGPDQQLRGRPGAAAGSGELLAPWPNGSTGAATRSAARKYQLELTSRPTATRSTPDPVASWQAPVSDGAQVLLQLQLLAGPATRSASTSRPATARPGRPDRDGDRAQRRVAPRPVRHRAPPVPDRRTPAIDGCELTLPAAAYLPAASAAARRPAADVAGSEFDFLARREFGTTSLDHALTDLRRDGDGRAWARFAVRGTRWPVGRPGYTWLQVFHRRRAAARPAAARLSPSSR